MNESFHLRIARPTADLPRAERMYRLGLRLSVLDRFEGHAGFDGVMLGHEHAHFHLELTHCRAHPVAATPSAEDLLVFYIRSTAEWASLCTSMHEAGFRRVVSFNPYWDQHGSTFEDHDGHRVVLCNHAWNPTADK